MVSVHNDTGRFAPKTHIFKVVYDEKTVWFEKNV